MHKFCAQFGLCSVSATLALEYPSKSEKKTLPNSLHFCCRLAQAQMVDDHLSMNALFYLMLASIIQARSVSCCNWWSFLFCAQLMPENQTLRLLWQGISTDRHSRHTLHGMWYCMWAVAWSSMAVGANANACMSRTRHFAFICNSFDHVDDKCRTIGLGSCLH